MRVKTLYSGTIVRLKDGRVCKILDVRYKPIEIKATDLHNDKEVVLTFREIDKILYEKTPIDTVIELMPAIGATLSAAFLSGLLKEISKKVDEKEGVKKEER